MLARKIVAEAVATALLLATIIGSGIVGAYIAAAYWFTASTSFANPAVTLGRAVSDTFAGIRPDDILGFIVAQLVGAALACALAKWLYGWRMD